MTPPTHFVILTVTCLFALTYASSIAKDRVIALHKYHASPKLTGPLHLTHAANDDVLNALDAALEKISTVYMQALFSGTHTHALESQMRSLEIELFDLLDQLYKQNRIADYMKYEQEVTRQMIIYNMLKKLFGYAKDDNEKVD